MVKMVSDKEYKTRERVLRLTEADVHRALIDYCVRTIPGLESFSSIEVWIGNEALINSGPEEFASVEFKHREVKEN